VTLFWHSANTRPQLTVYSGIIVEAMRQTWTDDRMDDLVQRVDNGFAQVHADIAALRADNTEIRREMAGLGSELRRENEAFASELRKENKEFASEMRTESKMLAGELRGETNAFRTETNRRFDALSTEMNQRFGALTTEMNQRFDAFDRRFDLLLGTMLTGFVGLIVSHFLA